MSTAPEESGYDIATPMIDHTLSATTAAGHAAIKIHRDIQQLLMTRSCLEARQACMESNRLLFIIMDVSQGILRVGLVLAADTLHHLPLNEQVSAMLTNRELQERADAWQWVASYKLIVEKLTQDGAVCVYQTEGSVSVQSSEFPVDISEAISAVHSLFQENTNLRRRDLRARFILNMKNQEEQKNVYEKAVHMDPAIFSCLHQLNPLLTSTTHCQANDKNVRSLSFIDAYVRSKDLILSTISTHLRSGFRQCPLTEQLKLPGGGENGYKDYSACLAIYKLLEDKGLLRPMPTTTDGSCAELQLSIPLCVLAPPIHQTDQALDADEAGQRSIYFTHIPVILPSSLVGDGELDYFDKTGQWRQADLEAIQTKILRKQSLLMNAQKRMKQAAIMNRMGSSRGYNGLLDRLTDGSNILGGIQYFLRPGAERRLTEDCDLEPLVQQAIQTAGPESVRDSVGTALLGRYRQDSML